MFATIKSMRPRGGRLSWGYFGSRIGGVAFDISRDTAVAVAQILASANFGFAGSMSPFAADRSLHPFNCQKTLFNMKVMMHATYRCQQITLSSILTSVATAIAVPANIQYVWAKSEPLGSSPCAPPCPV